MFASCITVFVVDDQQPEDAVMGDPSEREYDASLIFKHLCVFASPFRWLDSLFRRCFYIDSPDNARKNGMTVNTKYERDITEQCVFVDFLPECMSAHIMLVLPKFLRASNRTEARSLILTIPS